MKAICAGSLIKASVENEKGSSKSALLQRLFTKWFDGLVYNQIWEDPEVDLTALQVDERSKILTIASGGCNVLNYLKASPRSVDAVDINRAHLALTKFKVAAVKSLPTYEDFFALFGKGGDPLNEGRYYTFIRDTLDSDTKSFWEKRNFTLQSFGKKRISIFTDNLYRFSRSALFLRFMQRLCKIYGCDLNGILHTENLAAQQEYFAKHIEPVFDNRFVRFLSSLPVTLYSLGVPPQQFDEMCRQELRHPVDVYRERIRRLACQFPHSRNYFAWQAFGLRYNVEDQESLPLYLQKREYHVIKENAPRVSTHLSTLTDYLRRLTPGSLNRFVLLDSQDWMNKEQLIELWGEICRVAEDGTRVIFRTGGQRSILEEVLPSRLLSQISYERDRSSALTAQDRSAIYGGFHLYTVH